MMKDISTFYQKLGNYIRQMRESRHLTLDQLSELSGLNLGKSTLSEIETGKQKILPHQLFLVSKFFNEEINTIIEKATEGLNENNDNSWVSDDEITKLKNLPK